MIHRRTIIERDRTEPARLGVCAEIKVEQYSRGEPIYLIQLEDTNGIPVTDIISLSKKQALHLRDIIVDLFDGPE